MVGRAEPVRKLRFTLALPLTVVILLATATGSASAMPLPSVATPAAAAHLPRLTDWPTYLGNGARQSDAVGETTINTSSARNLVEVWNFTTGGEVVGSPAVVGNIVFVGSWDGYEYALNASTGHQLWRTFLGQDPYGYRTTGVTSSPTVANGVVYVGGGGRDWFALSAGNGSVLWKVSVSNISAGFYNWASPLLVGSNAFIGLSSKGDNPLVRGGLVEVSLTSHRVLHTFYTTAKGTIGASIWTSPALDPATNTVFVTTGNPGPNGSTWAESLLAFNGSTMNLTGHWTVPVSQAPLDSDFGATPMVYSPAAGKSFVAASNKDDRFYVWNDSAIGAGPVWNRTTAIASSSKGPPNLGPAAWGGGRVYVAASKSVVGGSVENGSVHAFSQLTGRPLWVKGEPGPVLGAPLYADGTLTVVTGHDLLVLNAANGSTLFQFVANATFVGPPALGHGEIIEGCTNNVVYAFAPSTGPAPPHHSSATSGHVAKAGTGSWGARRASPSTSHL